MNFRVVSKVCEAMESLAFHRVIALLRTDPDHEQKLLLPRLLALLPVAVSCLWSFLDFLKVFIVSELNPPCSALCIEAPESRTNIRSSVSLAPSQEH